MSAVSSSPIHSLASNLSQDRSAQQRYPRYPASAKKYFSSDASRGTQRTGCKLRIQAPTQLPTASGCTRRTHCRSGRNKCTNVRSERKGCTNVLSERHRYPNLYSGCYGPTALTFIMISVIRRSEANQAPLTTHSELSCTVLHLCIYAFMEFYILR